MADLSAPQQNSLRYLADLLRKREEIQGQMNPTMMGTLMDLILPSAGFVEKLSYGDPLFRMPPSGTGGYIPITANKEYAAEAASYIPAVGPAAKTATRVSNQAADQLVRMITRNPQATAPGVIQETAMPFMQAVAPRTPGLLETPVKSDLGFYSALEQATMPLQNKGTGAQFLAQIEKTAGVKPEEVKWTGLDEFLRSRQNVTKQEVQDYLAANRVNLQEVRLGSPLSLAEQQEIKNLRAKDRMTMSERARFDVLANKEDSVTSPKFSKYTVPGGQNYREILLTLPEGSKSPVYKAQKALDDANKAYDADQSYENYQRVLSARDEADKVGADWKSPEFRSSHFDQPNILAHMRVNDRVVDGKKTLFIEEIQSDWHQAGRKRGYGTVNKLPENYSVKQDLGSSGQPWGVVDENGEFITSGFHKSEKDAITEAIQKLNKGTVPDAPFKTSWHELTLKRAIQEASEKGYDQIAFTTGKTQAERYDLSKQVSTLRAPYDNGEYVVSYIPKGANDYEYMGRFLEKDLPGAVGKELAEKIVANKGTQTMTYKGDDLRIGGEGMKGFYDNILPKSLDKLGKKFDAKVGKTTMDGVEVWSMDITPKMRESVLTKGQPLFAATPAVGLLGRDEEE